MPSDKLCPTCKQFKPIDDFAKCWRNRDTLKRQCKQCIKAIRKRQRDKNPEKYRSEYTRNYQSLRYAAMGVLGNSCMRCGFADVRALQIDHRNGGGRKEVRQIGNWRMYRRVIAHPEEYQLLCANCN